MTRLTILHTNDLHGRVEQVFRIAALAKQIKPEVTAHGGHAGCGMQVMPRIPSSTKAV